jgi:hypothetical protein
MHAWVRMDLGIGEGRPDKARMIVLLLLLLVIAMSNGEHFYHCDAVLLLIIADSSLHAAKERRARAAEVSMGRLRGGRRCLTALGCGWFRE